jgi:hypothetical protein
VVEDTLAVMFLGNLTCNVYPNVDMAGGVRMKDAQHLTKWKFASASVPKGSGKAHDSNEMHAAHATFLGLRLGKSLALCVRNTS